MTDSLLVSTCVHHHLDQIVALRALAHPFTGQIRRHLQLAAGFDFTHPSQLCSCCAPGRAVVDLACFPARWRRACLRLQLQLLGRQSCAWRRPQKLCPRAGLTGNRLDGCCSTIGCLRLSNFLVSWCAGPGFLCRCGSSILQVCRAFLAVLSIYNQVARLLRLPANTQVKELVGSWTADRPTNPARTL